MDTNSFSFDWLSADVHKKAFRLLPSRTEIPALSQPVIMAVEALTAEKDKGPANRRSPFPREALNDKVVMRRAVSVATAALVGGYFIKKRDRSIRVISGEWDLSLDKESCAYLYVLGEIDGALRAFANADVPRALECYANACLLAGVTWGSSRTRQRVVARITEPGVRKAKSAAESRRNLALSIIPGLIDAKTRHRRFRRNVNAICDLIEADYLAAHSEPFSRRALEGVVKQLLGAHPDRFHPSETKK